MWPRRARIVGNHRVHVECRLRQTPAQLEAQQLETQVPTLDRLEDHAAFAVDHHHVGLLDAFDQAGKEGVAPTLLEDELCAGTDIARHVIAAMNQAGMKCSCDGIALHGPGISRKAAEAAFFMKHLFATNARRYTPTRIKHRIKRDAGRTAAPVGNVAIVANQENAAHARTFIRARNAEPQAVVLSECSWLAPASNVAIRCNDQMTQTAS